MFGSYSVINVVVLLNLLIAMMSTSYNIISERADVEWKFARTTLFMNYFEEGNTVPPPFNIFPGMKHIFRLFGKRNSFKDTSTNDDETKMREIDSVYQSVMCNLVWRYVTSQQKETESHPITEDNINELRQDIHSFRHDLMRVLKSSGMNTKEIEKDETDVTGKRAQVHKRRLIKDFRIGLMEVCTEEAAPEVAQNKGVLARLVGLSGTEKRSSQRWRDLIQAVKTSKIISNRNEESTRFGSMKKNKSDEDSLNNTLKNNEFHKSEQRKNKGSPENKLCTSTREEKIAQTVENISTEFPVLSPTLDNGPLDFMTNKDKNSFPKAKEPLTTGIKLLPEALMKQTENEIYPISKSNVFSSNEYFSQAPLCVNRDVTNSTENLTYSVPGSVPIGDGLKENLVSTICKSTSVRVTHSPEKLTAPRASLMTSVEIENEQTTSKLTDLNKNQDSSSIFKISFKDNLNDNINKCDNVNGNVRAVSTTYFKPQQSNMVGTAQALNLDGSSTSLEPPTFEQGWL